MPGDSFVHRLDPRTKIICSLVLLAAIMIAGNWPACLGIGLLLLSGILAAGIPGRILWRSLRPFWFVLLLTFLLQLFFTPGRTLYHLGPLHPTREGLVLGGQMLWRLTMFVITGSLLTLTTSPLKLTAGLESLCTPGKRFGLPVHELAMMMTIAVRFIPTLFAEAQLVIKAQQSRGADFTRGPFWKRAKGILPLLVPLIAGSFRRAEELATAMEARCYRGGIGRTRMEELKPGKGDAVALAASALMLAVVIWLRRWGW